MLLFYSIVVLVCVVLGLSAGNNRESLIAGYVNMHLRFLVDPLPGMILSLTVILMQPDLIRSGHWLLVALGTLYVTGIIVDLKLASRIPNERNKEILEGHTVRIWYSEVGLRFGHAALKLSNGHYISFWPAEGGIKMGSPLKKLPVRGVFGTSTDQDDFNEEGPPDVEIYIPTYLVDAEKVINWRDSQEKANGKYKLKTRDCADAVETALEIGGLHLLGAIHRFGLSVILLATPNNTLHKLKLTLAFMQLNTFMKVVYVLLQIGTAFVIPPTFHFMGKKIWPWIRSAITRWLDVIEKFIFYAVYFLTFILFINLLLSNLNLMKLR